MELPNPMLNRDKLKPERRNVYVGGRRTTMKLEQAWWDALDGIHTESNMSIDEIVTQVDRVRGEVSLTGAIRVYVLDFFSRRQFMSVPSRTGAK